MSKALPQTRRVRLHRLAEGALNIFGVLIVLVTGLLIAKWAAIKLQPDLLTPEVWLLISDLCLAALLGLTVLALPAALLQVATKPKGKGDNALPSPSGDPAGFYMDDRNMR